MNDTPTKYFVDCWTGTEMKRGGIAWPLEDAKEIAEEKRKQHPKWVVEINPLQGTP